jgi:hypothetical protein
MGIVPAHEHSKRTEDEWVEAIKTEYGECAKKTKFTSKAEAMAACLRLATNVRLVVCWQFSLFPFPFSHLFSRSFQLPLYGHSVFPVKPSNPEQFGFAINESTSMVPRPHHSPPPS